MHKLCSASAVRDALVALIVLLVLVLAWMIIRAVSRPDTTGMTQQTEHIANTANDSKQATAKPIELPGGGQKLFPGRRVVALYGSPNAPVLGVLGEQPPEAAVARVLALAAEYQPLTDDRVLPAFEIITTVASASPTANNDYSNELDIATLRPWVDAAKAAGVYVVLDLQPGRVDFLSQAKLYEPLLREAHVGLAIDPEWRLGPDQVHMKQIGTVDAAEINQVSTWLASLTKAHTLPQKLLLLHQFRTSMITNRSTLDLSHPELAITIQMDGNGAQSTKRQTWDALRQDAQPEPGLRFGWKNFHDEDTPMLTPAETLRIVPQPWFISYQ